MEFNIGDKVAFLNEPLKGVVLSLINDTHVTIDCDGIEMDVAKSELIRINYIPKIEGKHKFPIKKKNKLYDSEPDLIKKADDYEPLKVGDQVSFMSDNIKGIVVAINSKNEYEVEIEKNFTIPVNRIEIEKIIVKDIMIDETQLESKVKEDNKVLVNTESKSNKENKTYFNHNECDLHIESLCNSWSGLSNFQIVQLQLKHFRERLHQAIKDNEPSFVVIHGVGKGVLKQEIYKYIEQFSFVYADQADAKLYGMGATEIKIYNSKH